MVVVRCCLWVVVCSVILVSRFVCWFAFVVYDYWLFVVWGLCLFVVLFAVVGWLSVGARCALDVVCCSVVVICCLLCVVSCLLFDELFVVGRLVCVVC